MGDADAIAAVGRSLVELLRDRMDSLLNDGEEVALASPADADNDIRATLYLYDVAPNAHLQNAPAGVQGDPPTQPDQPLRLDLRYLLTAYPSGNEGNQRSAGVAEHRVLGRAMQALHDAPVIHGSDLDDDFDDDEVLHVSTLPEAREEAVSVWNTFEGEPYRPSVAYLVTPVEIESTRAEPVERVRERTVTEHLPESGEGGDG